MCVRVSSLSRASRRSAGSRHVDQYRTNQHGACLRLLSVTDGRPRLEIALRSRHVLRPAADGTQLHRSDQLSDTRLSVGRVHGSAVYRHGWRSTSCLSNVDLSLCSSATSCRTHCRWQVRVRRSYVRLLAVSDCFYYSSTSIVPQTFSYSIRQRGRVCHSVCLGVGYTLPGLYLVN